MVDPPMPRFSGSDDETWEICHPCEEGFHDRCVETDPSLDEDRPLRCECACVEDRIEALKGKWTYVPLPKYPIAPSKRGLQRIEEANFVVRIHEYDSDEKEMDRPEDLLLDWGSTVRLPGPDLSQWVLEIIQVVEREAE